jgi:hypothetical protein
MESLFSSIENLLIPLFSLGVLLLTYRIYTKILKVSENTLAYTKSQTSFNIYLDNFKLFNELSKRKVAIVLEGELLPEQKTLFENMTFESIHLHYIEILKAFPSLNNHINRTTDINYEIVFRRFNYKVQSFINILYDEIKKIQGDNNISESQKVNIINLYKIFLLFDYIGLSKDLIQNMNLHKDILPPTYIPDLLKCNTVRNNFDIEQFLKLYNEIEKEFEQ